jgi:D-alanyl-D-alanine carboxypeptidase
MLKTRAITGFFLSLIFLAFFIYSILNINYLLKNNFLSGGLFLGNISNSNVAKISQPTPEQKEIEQPQINAESAFSVESNLLGFRKVILQKENNKKLPIASLTKLMTAVIVLDKYKLSQKTIVSKIADSQDMIKQDVKFGDNMTVENFLDIMLVGSSNKSAYALSEIMGESIFVDLMNKKAKDIGLENTFFADPTGLSAQNVSTATDLAKLAEYILKNYPKIGDISRMEELNIPDFGKLSNTDQLLGEVPEIVCSKTGFTNQAKGCLLLVTNNKQNNNYVINVILGAEDRFFEMKKIINFYNDNTNLKCN